MRSCEMDHYKWMHEEYLRDLQDIESEIALFSALRAKRMFDPDRNWSVLFTETIELLQDKKRRIVQKYAYRHKKNTTSPSRLSFSFR
jgi:hypothetical protein